MFAFFRTTRTAPCLVLLNQLIIIYLSNVATSSRCKGFTVRHPAIRLSKHGFFEEGIHVSHSEKLLYRENGLLLAPSGKKRLYKTCSLAGNTLRSPFHLWRHVGWAHTAFQRDMATQERELIPKSEVVLGHSGKIFQAQTHFQATNLPQTAKILFFSRDLIHIDLFLLTLRIPLYTRKYWEKYKGRVLVKPSFLIWVDYRWHKSRLVRRGVSLCDICYSKLWRSSANITFQ